MKILQIFGPVPSRRFGRSLGINHIPFKNCSYSCAYCQLGQTQNLKIIPREYYPLRTIFEAVKQKLDDLNKRNEKVDFLTLVPDGEPTLDMNLGELLVSLKQFSLPLAVITNASLLWKKQVREELLNSDVVSLKVDAVDEQLWHKVNRPHVDLHLDQVLAGMVTFAKEFKGKIISESMLLQGINDNDIHINSLVNFLQKLKPAVAYIAVPTRPSVEAYAIPSRPYVVARAFQIFSEKIPHVELLVEPEGDDFAVSGDIQQDILSISSVHPLSKQKLRKMLEKANTDWSVVDDLLQRKMLKRLRYQDQDFYIRNFEVNN